MERSPKGLFVLPDGRNLIVTFILVSALFLLWGFCNGMIDVMDKHFQQVLHLTLARSAWVQFAHYLGYFLMALPAGWLATKLGYKGGIIVGLLMVAVGGLWFYPATHLAAFWAFLLGVCLIAAGLTFLETVANPYSTVLGPPQFAATRINLAQSCNGIGWIFGPIAGGMFFYGKDAAGESDSGVSHSIWGHPHFVMAVIAQFLYVAAQAGIFSFFINYMTSEVPPIPESWRTGPLASWFEPGQPGALALSDRGAAYLASLGFVCFLAGRLSGAGILKKFSPSKVLGLYGLLNVLVCGLVFLKLGWLSVVCVFLSYFFMSIMFPTIFALGIHGLGARAKQASAFLVMAIMGGAILPKLMGAVADHWGMSRAFAVPLCCFAFVSVYGFNWSKLSRPASGVLVRPS